MHAKDFFHKISYLQYPFMLVALIFVFIPYYDIFILKDKSRIFENFNIALIFMGIAVSFTSLQDTTKTQNKFSKKIWESRKKGKYFLIYIASFITTLLIIGLYGYFTNSEKSPLKELSLGVVIFAIGLIGSLKSAIEMAEYHRKD